MTDDLNRFTPTQRQIIAKVTDMLDEHFKAGVVAVVADEVTEGPEDNELFGMKYFGGCTCAVGLCERAKMMAQVETVDEN